MIAPAILAILLGASAAFAAGEAPGLYEKMCARCHGLAGDGKGPAGVALAFNGRPPRDFTAGRFRFKSTPTGTAPSDDDLRRTIGLGLAATAMPGFGDVLSADDLDALIRTVRGFAREPLPESAPIDPGLAPPDDAESRSRGQRLYRDLGCAVCHGEHADGRGRTVADLRNEDGSAARPVDLRRPWGFRGGSEPRDVVLRLATGLAGTPMPSYLDAATIADLWDVAHWLGSIAVAPSLRDAAILAAKLPPGEGHELAARGEYVAKSGTCFLCHVQMQEDGAYREGSFGAGGMKVRMPTVTTVSTRNLTPDPETGIGGWSADDLRRAVKRGTSRDGRRLGTLDMPWTIFTMLEDRDVDALHAFLATLPPVRNAVPSPEAPSLDEGIVRKIAMVARGEQVKAGFHPGNTGSTDGAAPPPANPLALKVALGLFALAFAIFSIAVFRGRLVVTVVAALVTVGAWTYAWPPLEFLPVGLVAADPEWSTLAKVFAFPPIRRPPAPEPIADPDLAALAERGRYVATIGTGSLCHTAGPNLTNLYARFPEMGGGMRVEWKVFGTTYSRNLTPDPETGLGDWSDEEIRRAFTTGLARDGRVMHWQAMPWDHFSNLTLEDQDALVFYLRSLPARWSKVPDRTPTSDEPGDTFFFGYSGEYRR